MFSALVQKLWQEYLDKKEHESSDLSLFVNEINNNLNSRDYVLGFPLQLREGGISNNSAIAMMGEFISSVGIACVKSEQFTDKQIVPLQVLCAIFVYELGDPDVALAGLNEALETDPDYSLAKLIVRSINGGIPAETVWQMREELHERVVAQL